MARLAFGSTLASFKRSGSNVVESTTAGRFDPAFSPGAIFVPQDVFLETMPFIDTPSVTTFWAFWDIYGASGSTTTHRTVEVLNSARQVVLFMRSRSIPATEVSYWNGTSYVNAGSITFAIGGAGSTGAASLSRVGFKLICGAAGSLELFGGGTSVGVLAIPNAAVDNVAAVRLGTNSSSSANHYSQFVAADYDIRDVRLRSHLASANGFHQDGIGGFADVNEAILDDGTSVRLTASGQRRSFLKPAVTVPAGYAIGGMCVSARGRVGGSVSDGKLLVRSGSSTQSSSGRAFNGGYEPRGEVFEVDPATAGAWSEAAFNAAEFGVEAA